MFITGDFKFMQCVIICKYTKFITNPMSQATNYFNPVIDSQSLMVLNSPLL